MVTSTILSVDQFVGLYCSGYFSIKENTVERYTICKSQTDPINFKINKSSIVSVCDAIRLNFTNIVIDERPINFTCNE